jgi:hypothetical protein
MSLQLAVIISVYLQKSERGFIRLTLKKNSSLQMDKMIFVIPTG